MRTRIRPRPSGGRRPPAAQARWDGRSARGQTPDRRPPDNWRESAALDEWSEASAVAEPSAPGFVFADLAIFAPESEAACPSPAGEQAEQAGMAPRAGVAARGGMPSAHPSPGQTQADPHTLLDRAAAEPGAPLPQRQAIEARLGHSLDGATAHTGPAARQALDALGARAATRGQHVFLAEPEPGLDVVTHEAVHTLQATGTDGASPSAPVVAAHAPAEQQADRLTRQVLCGEASPAGEKRELEEPNEKVGAGAVALLRPGAGAPPAPPPGSAGTPAEAFAAATGAPRSGANPGAGPFSAPTRPSTAPGGVSPSPAPGRAPSTAPSTAPTAAPTTAAPAAGPTTAPGADAATAAGDAAAAAGLDAAAPLAPGLTPEEIAAQQQANAQATAALEAAQDVNGLVDAFAGAPPTAMAQHYDALGTDADRLAKADETSYQETLPDLHAQLSGEVPEAAPLDIGSPGARDLTLEATPPPPAPDPEVAPTVDPGPFTVNDRIADAIARLFGTQTGDRATQIGESLNDVKTTDPAIETTAGAPPTVPLEGENDPERMAKQQDEGAKQARQVRDEAQQAVVGGPGPELVQPRVMDEAYPLTDLGAPTLEPPGPVEGPQGYLALNLTPDVQAAFDQDQQAAMQSSMEEPRGKVADATTERDAGREAEVTKANDAIQAQTVAADTEQRTQVQSARDKIQDERRTTLEAQSKAVADAEDSVETERKRQHGEIDTRVEHDQQQIRDHYDQADKDAKAEVKKGETKAAEEKAKAEREAADKSWWERAVDFVKDAFDALTSLIGDIFDAVRGLVNGILDAVKKFATELIDAVAGFIKGLIAAFGEFLKLAIDGLIGQIFPELAEKLKAGIDSAVTFAQSAVDTVADGLKKGVNAIVGTLQAGLNAVLNVWQAAITLGLGLVEAVVTGDWDAFAQKALEAALRVAGVSKEEFYGFVGHERETLQIIVDDPLGFVGNAVNAVIGGFQRFGENFGTHLEEGIIGWLTGAIGGVGITLPERFDLLGVLDIARQILGLTYDYLRKRAVDLIGEENVERIEFIASYLQTLIAEGWTALLERISNDLTSLRNTVLGQIVSYLLERVVMAAVTTLATMFNPVGALVQLLILAWNLYTFLRDQLARIIEVLRSVVAMIGDIARGVLEPAAIGVEGILARLLPLAIDLLARFLRLGAVGEKVREIIEAIRDLVNTAIDKLINWIKGLFKGKGEGEAEGELVAEAEPGAAGTGADQIGENLPLVAGGQSHHVFIVAAGEGAEVMVESTRQTVGDWLQELGVAAAGNEPLVKLLEEARGKAGSLKAYASAVRTKVLAHLTQKAATAAAPTPIQPTDEQGVVKEERDLVTVLGEVLEGLRQDVKSYLKNPAKRLFADGKRTSLRLPYGYEDQTGGENPRIARNKGFEAIGYEEVYVDDDGVLQPGRRPVGEAENVTPNAVLIKAYQGILTAAGVPTDRWPPDPSKVDGKDVEPSSGPTEKYRELMRSRVAHEFEYKPVADLNSQVLNVNRLFAVPTNPSALNRIRGDIFEEWLEIAFPERIEPYKVVFRFLRDKPPTRADADRISGDSLVEAKAVTTSGPLPKRERGQAGTYARVFSEWPDVEVWLTHTVTDARTRDTSRKLKDVIYYFNQDPADTTGKRASQKWSEDLDTILKGLYSIVVVSGGKQPPPPTTTPTPTEGTEP
jgi:hypothetical protein